MRPAALHAPDSLQLVLGLPLLRPASHEQVPGFGLAALNVHELVELEHSALAATPALAPLVEDGRAGMMHAALSCPVPSGVRGPAAPSSARHALLQRDTRLIVLRLGPWGWRFGRALGGLRSRKARGGRGKALL